MKIVADNAIPFLKGVLEPYARVEYLPGKTIATADVRDADALIVRTRTRCDAALLEGSSVKLIATATIGFDHIDTEYCRRHGIEVATAAGCNARGVLQYVAAALVRLSRVQAWEPADKTLGIVGVGHVGSLVEAYARTWGFRVVACDPPREEREHGGFLPLEEVACQADILTFHTPLDDTTRHMAGAKLFERMKPGSILINTSRGEVVDGQALRESGLQYVLDVWEHEPDLDESEAQGRKFAERFSVAVETRRQTDRVGKPKSEYLPFERRVLGAVHGTQQRSSARDFPDHAQQEQDRAVGTLDVHGEQDGFDQFTIHNGRCGRFRPQS